MTQGLVVHIFLVGTSIIRNFASSERMARLPDELRELVKSWTRVIDDPRAREHLGRGVLFQELVNFAKEKPRQASAELNAYLSLIVDLGFKEFKADKVYLLHSDTYLCSLCARVLKEYLVSEAEVETIAVYGLGKIFEEGLANLFEGILRVARQHPHPDTVLLNATGGFKPESAIATLAAALGNATAVYYIHEAFRKAEIIPLPVLKISEDTKQLLDIARKLEGKSTEELKKLPKLIQNRLLLIIERRKEKIKIREWVKSLMKYA